jgi:CRISPR-associated endonuclease/helicase Cas3
MLLIKNTNRHKKFLFLSATPNKQLIERLQLAGFRCKEINPIEENKYQFPDTELSVSNLKHKDGDRYHEKFLFSLSPSNPAIRLLKLG